MMELRGMWSTPSLPSLSGPLSPKDVAPDKVVFIGQIELFDNWTECKQIELLEIELFDHLSVCKQITDLWLNW